MASEAPPKKDENEKKLSNLEVEKLLKKALDKTKQEFEQPSLADSDRIRLAIERMMQMATEWRKTDIELQSFNKKNQSLASEVDGLTREHTTEHAKRMTLDGLAKDLNAQKKNIIDQSHTLADEEKLRRVELTKSLQAKLTEINAKVEETERERVQLLHENGVLKEKIKVINEYLENKDKKYAQMLEEKNSEATRFHEQMEERITQAFKSIAPQNSEGELKTQLTAYQDKFEEFKEMIGKSSQVFDVFKGDMDKLNERLAQAERDQAELRQKCDVVDVQVLNLVQRKEQILKIRQTLRQEKTALETECRARKESKQR